MNLVKWLRKNNTKIMAIVVIVIMIGFIGGSSLSYILRGSSGTNKTIAYYADKMKIKRVDLMQAQNELELLKSLQSAKILKMLQIPLIQTPDFHALMLGELLFSDQRPSPDVLAYVKQTAAQYQLRIGNEQIDAMYNRTVQSYFYWFLLSKEAERAGFKVDNENARMLLSQAIPSLFGQNYATFMTRMVSSNTVSETEILSAFAKLLSILRYSHSICSDEDITNRQLKHMMAWEEEGINVELVELNSDDFIEEQEEPSETQISEHFEQYKTYFPNEIDEYNPYGFGYMLPDRVKIEYLAIKLDDLSKIVKEPDFDEMEEFYNTNKEQYTEQVLSNPDDPNSELVTRTKPFSVMADTISKQLFDKKVNAQAASIIQEAVNISDASIQDFNDTELNNISLEERIKLAGSYEKIAADLSTKYGIKVYTGSTGELSAMDIRNDEYLSTLYLQGYVNQLGLAQIAFAVDELGTSELGSYEPVRPRMYESISPVKDISGQIIAAVRIIDAIKSSEPENVNVFYSTVSMVFDPNEDETEEKVFSVKEKVIKDLKKLSAMETAKDRANVLLELVANDGAHNWENAIDKFNELYGQANQDLNDPNDPNSIDSNAAEKEFKLENLNSLRRLSKATLDTMSMQIAGDPAEDLIIRERQKGAAFVDLLFSIAPEDANETDSEFEPVLLELKEGLSCYAVKNVSINSLWKENYESFKSTRAFTEDHVESQSLALSHYNPANIIKRMNLVFPDEPKEDSESETE